MKPGKSWAALFGCAMLAACSSAPTVQTTSLTPATDLSGYWSDADATLVAQAMVSKALADPWLTQFMQLQGGKQPGVMVGTVHNLSPEHISISTFIEDLQQALIDSGKVRFIPPSAESYTVRNPDASVASSVTSSKVKADYMLQGTLNAVIDNKSATGTKWYEVDMRLIDMHDMVIVWAGQQKIKKSGEPASGSLHP